LVLKVTFKSVVLQHKGDSHSITLFTKHIPLPIASMLIVVPYVITATN